MTTASKKGIPKKKRGRPATGRDPIFTARMPKALIGQIEALANAHDINRSDALRQLVERGLSTFSPSGRTSAKSAASASRMAGKAIDRQADQSASVEERASRKRRLLKGPKEFRDMREDHQRTRKPRA
jgi:hypothetical protein